MTPRSLCSALLVICCCGAGGCAALKQALARNSSKSPVIEANLSEGTAADNLDAENPFALEVIDEINDGKILYVRGEVQANTDWRDRDVVVRLTGLSEGKPTGTGYAHLVTSPEFQVDTGDDAARRKISAAQKIPFVVSIPTEHTTDYQLELLWGEEAVAHLRSFAPEPESKTEEPAESSASLVVKDLKLTTVQSGCRKPPCSISYRVEGKLQNQGAKSIKNATIGVSFADMRGRKQLDFKSYKPENEEQVELKLNLVPGGSQPIRLVLDREIPKDRLAMIQPVVRVVSFQ